MFYNYAARRVEHELYAYADEWSPAGVTVQDNVDIRSEPQAAVRT